MLNLKLISKVWFIPGSTFHQTPDLIQLETAVDRLDPRSPSGVDHFRFLFINFIHLECSSIFRLIMLTVMETSATKLDFAGSTKGTSDSSVSVPTTIFPSIVPCSLKKVNP